jgi:phosphonate transport system substrate-binding protein
MNAKRYRFTLLMMLISMLVFTAACGNKQEQQPAGNQASGSANTSAPFTLAVIPQQNQGDMQTAMNKLSTILKEKLQREVSIKVYPDYNGVVEAMNFGQVDMAYFGPLTYVIAHHDSGAEAIITQLIKGSPFYYSYIITHKDNPANTMEELLANSKNVSFAFGDPNSTSGSLIPGIELKKRGVYTDAQTHQFKEVRFTGSHDVTALAVQNKQVDAGAIDSAIYDTLVEQKKIDASQFKTIWKSEKLFQYPWAVKKGTDAKTIQALQDAFVGVKDEEVLKAFGASAFTKAENKDYEAIREAAEKDGRLKKK